MLETKCVGNRFKMLVNVWPFGSPTFTVFSHSKNVTNIEMLALTLSHQHYCHHLHVKNLLRPLCLKKGNRSQKLTRLITAVVSFSPKKLKCFFVREISETHGVGQKKCEILFLSFKLSIASIKFSLAQSGLKSHQ